MSVSRCSLPAKVSLCQELIAAAASRCAPEAMMERKLRTPWSRQMASRDGSPVAAGFTYSPSTLRFARACGVSFTNMVFDMKLGVCPWLLAPIGAGPDPPGNVPRSVIARAYSADKRSKDTAITNTTFLTYLVFIFHPQLKGPMGIYFYTVISSRRVFIRHCHRQCVRRIRM